MPDITTMLRAQLMPLTAFDLLVPNSAVAEIIPWQAPVADVGQPDWRLGTLAWRDMQIPMIALETARGETYASPPGGGRIAVLNSLKGTAACPFFAVALRGLPRLLRLSSEQLDTVEQDAGVCGLQWVRVGERQALIPDLDAIEALVLRR